MAEIGQEPLQLLEDSKLVAFLKLKGHGMVARICRDDPDDVRVGFEITGDQEKINIDVQAYYANESVGIQDFCRCLNEVKSQMYNLRRLHRRGGK